MLPGNKRQAIGCQYGRDGFTPSCVAVCEQHCWTACTPAPIISFTHFTVYMCDVLHLRHFTPLLHQANLQQLLLLLLLLLSRCHPKVQRVSRKRHEGKSKDLRGACTSTCCTIRQREHKMTPERSCELIQNKSLAVEQSKIVQVLASTRIGTHIKAVYSTSYPGLNSTFHRRDGCCSRGNFKSSSSYF